MAGERVPRRSSHALTWRRRRSIVLLMWQRLVVSCVCLNLVWGLLPMSASRQPPDDGTAISDSSDDVQLERHASDLAMVPPPDRQEIRIVQPALRVLVHQPARIPLARHAPLRAASRAPPASR